MSTTGLGATQPTQKIKILAPKSTLFRTACERWLSENKGKETQNHYSKVSNALHPATLCTCFAPRIPAYAAGHSGPGTPIFSVKNTTIQELGKERAGGTT